MVIASVDGMWIRFDFALPAHSAHKLMLGLGVPMALDHMPGPGDPTLDAPALPAAASDRTGRRTSFLVFHVAA